MKQNPNPAGDKEDTRDAQPAANVTPILATLPEPALTIVGHEHYTTTPTSIPLPTLTSPAPTSTIRQCLHTLDPRYFRAGKIVWQDTGVWYG